MKERLTDDELAAAYSKIAETLDGAADEKYDRPTIRKHLLVIQEVVRAALADEYSFFE